nr:hypothetical protein [Tanacetum cinerariifolium]
MSLGYQNPFYLKQAQKKQQSLYDEKVLLVKHDPPVVHESEETLQLAQENISKRANVSISISIPNEEFSDDTTPSVARKFLKEEADASLAKHKILELEIERLLKAVVSQDIISVVQNASVVDTSDLQTKLEPYKDMQQKIGRLQAQLRDLKGKSTDIVSEHKDNTCDTSVNTKFAKQPIVENLPKIGKTNALSKPVTSNFVSTPQISKGVNNAKVIAPGMFRISPDKVSREAKKVPNTVSAKKVRNKCDTNKVSFKEIQMTYRPKVSKPKNVGTHESHATPKPRKPRFLLRWSPTGKMFDQDGKSIDFSLGGHQLAKCLTQQ